MTRESPLMHSAPATSPDLLVPPHVLTRVFDVCVGAGDPAPGQQEHLVAHLGGCPYCRTAVIAQLCIAQVADRRSGNDDSQAGQVLGQFAHIHRALEAAAYERTRAEAAAYERMGAYAEAIHALGRAAADEDPRFAALAAHVASCPDCQASLDGTLAFLADEMDLRDPNSLTFQVLSVIIDVGIDVVSMLLDKHSTPASRAATAG